MSDDEVCGRCQPADGGKREPGWCSWCGFFFDLYGMPILEPWRTCRVHSPIRSTCPHSGSLR